MLDNLTLLPGEAFEAMASVANNLIEKLAIATGFIFTPKGKRKDREEAVQFFIDEVKANEKMPLMAKAAAISTARKNIKEYENQVDIISMCSQYLSEDADANRVDEDWLTNFMDKARLISAEEVQIIFAKILAEECNKNGSVSKALVNTISIMDRESAKAFREFCKYTVCICSDGKEQKEALITTITDFEENHISIRFPDLVNLTSLGLIEYDALPAYGHEGSEAVVKYGDKVFTVSGNGNIPLGHANLTKTGDELANIIVSEAVDDYYEVIKAFFKDHGFSVKE